MDYTLPCYKRQDEVEVAFANQKNYISIYFLKEGVISRNKALLKGLNLGKGCIRYMKPEKIDLGIVKKLLIGSKIREARFDRLIIPSEVGPVNFRAIRFTPGRPPGS